MRSRCQPASAAEGAEGAEGEGRSAGLAEDMQGTPWRRRAQP